MLTLYRLVHQDHFEEAWTGKRASRVQVGRWHLPGIPMVYLLCSFSQALLFHQLQVQNRQALSKIKLISLKVPEDVIIGNLLLESLPACWKENIAVTQRLGTDWWCDAEQAILKIPCSLIEREFYYLLNIKHSDFKKCNAEVNSILI